VADKVGILVLRAPNYGLVALPDAVLESFAVTDPDEANALPHLADDAQNWSIVGEVEGDYAPPSPPVPGAPTGFGTPSKVGITGHNVPKALPPGTPG
jgi:hypothetical protein